MRYYRIKNFVVLTRYFFQVLIIFKFRHSIMIARTISMYKISERLISVCATSDFFRVFCSISLSHVRIFMLVSWRSDITSGIFWVFFRFLMFEFGISVVSLRDKFRFAVFVYLVGFFDEILSPVIFRVFCRSSMFVRLSISRFAISFDVVCSVYAIGSWNIVVPVFTTLLESFGEFWKYLFACSKWLCTYFILIIICNK